MKALTASALLMLFAGCAAMPALKPLPSAESDLSVLRKQFEQSHSGRNITAFVALHTETTEFEWRGRAARVTGLVALRETIRDVWSGRGEQQLNLQVSDLRVHGDRAYEFGSYEETWIDPRGMRITEFGRYVAAYTREDGGSWRIARLFGFSNLTATQRVGR